MKCHLALLAISALVATPLLAHADQFTLTLSPGYSFPNSVSFPTITADLSATANGDGSYTVSTASGQGIDGLLPVGNPAFPNDNLLFPDTFPSGSDPLGLYLPDAFNGLGVIATVDGTTYDFNVTGIFGLYAPGVNEVVAGSTGPHQAVAANVNIMQAASAPSSPTAVTPEPASFVLLGTGLLGTAGILRQRRAQRPAA